MLSWFYKFRPLGTPVTPPKSVAASSQAPAAAHPAVLRPPAVKPPAVPRADADAAQRLQGALGDDAALLQLALSAKGLELKLSAVQAIVGETVLKQAERAFRAHDRKVHRVAKQRLETAVAQREGRAQADRLLAHIAALLQEDQVPLNYVVALDRDWQALPTPLLQDSQTQQFVALRGQLEQVLRERSEALQSLQRWTLAVNASLSPGPAALLALAEQGQLADITLQAAALQALQASRPEAAAGSKPELALAQRLAVCQALIVRLGWLEQRSSSGPDAAPAEADASPVADQAELESEWAALPEVAEPAMAQLLQQRFARWQQDARQAQIGADPSTDPGPYAEAAPAANDTTALREPRGPKRPALTAEQLAQVEPLLLQAETAQAEGQLALLQQHLQAFEALLDAWPGAAVPGRMRGRHQALRAESQRLRDWQRWGGSRARDVLVAEAEVLARLTLDAAVPVAGGDVVAPAEPGQAEAAVTSFGAPDQVEAQVPETPDLPDEALAAQPVAQSLAQPPAQALSVPVEGDSNPDPAPPQGLPEAPPAQVSDSTSRRKRPKLKLQAHADAIADLRARWKALDRSGAAAPQEHWQRFDAALKTAFEPVAAQHAVLKAARQENLAARESLLAELEHLVPAEGAEPSDPRALQQGLDRFQLAWRRLGPVEYTAPQAARGTLTQRLEALLARAEGPLQTARAAAVAQREHLIAQALALAPEGQGANAGPDAARQVRELQFAWQEQARRLPLPRAQERDVWGRFKAATNAVFAQREAAVAARDSEMAANLAAAEALLQRLADLTAETPAAERQRTLAEVDRAWRQGGPVPRGAVERLEKRYATLTAGLEQQREAALRHAWQAQCDALMAQLALCQAREDSAAAADLNQSPDQAGASWDERWAALKSPSLPAAWQQAMAKRWQVSAKAGPLPTPALDEMLLQLEMALGLPATAEQQAAARLLKLRALKESMEGRAASKTTGAVPAEWLQAVLLQDHLSSAQQQRLQRFLAALRQAQPGALGLPLPAV